MSTELKCDGNCEQHGEQVKHVHVTGKWHDFGVFAYCDNAAETDRQRGLTVTDACSYCKGTGRDPMSDNVNWLPCPNCKGTGKP